MKRILHSRAAAILALILLIPISVVLGGRVALFRLAAKAEAAYTEDSARWGCAKSDAQKIAEYGDQLSAITAALTGDVSLAEKAEAARRAADASPIGQTEVVALYRAAAVAYQSLQIDPSLTDQQKRSATAYFYEMQSVMQRLANNEAYARAAARYNEACRSFPSSLWGGREAAVYPSA
jgi:xanthine dehydrogenase molybdopterin-binding subunit B